MAAQLLLGFVLLLPFLLLCSSSSYATELSRAPKIVDFFERLNHPEGTNATITCAIGSGDLDGLNFEWFKDNQKIVPSAKLRVSVLPENYNSILRAIDLKPNDSATYSCLAKNRYGQDRMSTKLFVKVQLKWVNELPAELEARVGESLQVACKASGQPEPTIEWTKLEERGPRVLGGGGELRFPAISQQDGGTYECRAKNGVDKDLVAQTKITVLGK